MKSHITLAFLAIILLTSCESAEERAKREAWEKHIQDSIQAHAKHVQDSLLDISKAQSAFAQYQNLHKAGNRKACLAMVDMPQIKKDIGEIFRAAIIKKAGNDVLMLALVPAILPQLIKETAQDFSAAFCPSRPATVATSAFSKVVLTGVYKQDSLGRWCLPLVAGEFKGKLCFTPDSTGTYKMRRLVEGSDASL